ncbi:hypothetical protein DFO72_11824 [Cytobacillus oceanisediminis]|uniref:Uncharacterized protein n=1 Tax=Cytobacillus oceanisediminis TaxID=665099 RepID=A0A4R8G3T8_9BACI|nr:hypothetical protein DFO72_11824 [Cytobacillus oceanisediminis]
MDFLLSSPMERFPRLKNRSEYLFSEQKPMKMIGVLYFAAARIIAMVSIQKYERLREE